MSTYELGPQIQLLQAIYKVHQNNPVTFQQVDRLSQMLPDCWGMDTQVTLNILDRQGYLYQTPDIVIAPQGIRFLERFCQDKNVPIYI